MGLRASRASGSAVRATRDSPASTTIAADSAAASAGCSAKLAASAATGASPAAPVATAEREAAASTRLTPTWIRDGGASRAPKHPHEPAPARRPALHGQREAEVSAPHRGRGDRSTEQQGEGPDADLGRADESHDTGPDREPEQAGRTGPRPRQLRRPTELGRSGHHQQHGCGCVKRDGDRHKGRGYRPAKMLAKRPSGLTTNVGTIAELIARPWPERPVSAANKSGKHNTARRDARRQSALAPSCSPASSSAVSATNHHLNAAGNRLRQMPGVR